MVVSGANYDTDRSVKNAAVRLRKGSAPYLPSHRRISAPAPLRPRASVPETFTVPEPAHITAVAVDAARETSRRA